jgi:hypothetical protein
MKIFPSITGTFLMFLDPDPISQSEFTNSSESGPIRIRTRLRNHLQNYVLGPYISVHNVLHKNHLHFDAIHRANEIANIP